MAASLGSFEDTKRKLSFCLCSFQRKPFFVKDVLSNKTVIGFFTQRGAGKSDFIEVSVADPEFSYTSPKLGYINIDDTTLSFVTRLPVRGVKQTLNKSNLNFDRLPRGLTKSKVLEEGYLNCLFNPSDDTMGYPSDILQLFQRMKKNYDANTGQALSKDWAFVKGKNSTIFLYYRKNKIGNVCKVTSNSLLLQKDFEFQSSSFLFVRKSLSKFLESKGMYLDVDTTY